VHADVFEYLEQVHPRADVLTANLVLHHFSQEQLTRLLSLAAQSTRLLVACAPTLQVRAANQPPALADRMQRSGARGRDSKRSRGLSRKGTFRIVANVRSLGAPRRCSKAIHAL